MSMDVSVEMIRKLRQKSGAGIMDCKEALAETKGDIEKAITLLRKKGKEVASKRQGKSTAQGYVGSYIHAGGKIGVLVEVNCETDFVARNEDFQAFTKEVAMQVAASNPLYISRENVPAKVLETEKEVIGAQVDSKKPEAVKEKIIAGKLEKFYQEACLLEQAYIRDAKMSIGDYLDSLVAKIGENIVIARFVRFEVGEES